MRLLSALCLLLWTALASAQVSTLSPFLGTWQNVRPDTRGLVRLEVVQIEGRTMVHTWLAASPTPRDGGLVGATLFNEMAPIPAGRRRGAMLVSPPRVGAPAGELLMIEQADAGALTVTYLLGSGDGPAFERATMRRVEARGVCLDYDPRTVAVDGDTVRAGRQALMAFSDPRDRDLGASLARAYARQCFIGRGNARPDRRAYILEYWEGGRGGDTAPTFDCLAYDPARLRIANLGAAGYRIEWPTPTGTSMLQLFDTLADATAGLEVFRRHTRQCFIGRSASAAASPRTPPYQYLR